MLSLSSCPKPHSNGESGGITAVSLSNPNATCVPFKGQSHASNVDLLLGCPETEDFREICAVMRTITL